MSNLRFQIPGGSAIALATAWTLAGAFAVPTAQAQGIPAQAPLMQMCRPIPPAVGADVPPSTNLTCPPLYVLVDEDNPASIDTGIGIESGSDGSSTSTGSASTSSTSSTGSRGFGCSGYGFGGRGGKTASIGHAHGKR